MTAIEHVQRSAPKHVQITHKAPAGVISFLNRKKPTLEHPDGPQQEIRTERFMLRGQPYMLVSFDGDPDWELFRVDFDGSRLFEGYASDVLPAILRGQRP